MSVLALWAVFVYSTVIIPLGDSITQGIAPYDSYRKYLWEMLLRDKKDARFGGSKWGSCALGKPWQQEITPGYDQNHEGHCAIDTGSLLRRLTTTPPEELIKVNSTHGTIAKSISAQDVGVVLLHIGSNDVFDIVRKKKKLHALDKIVDQMNMLIAHLLVVYPNSTIFVAQIIRTTFPRQTEYFNNRIQTHVNETTRVRLVSFPNFTTEAHTFDTTHPNNLGARYIAERWFDAISSLIPTRTATSNTSEEQASNTTTAVDSRWVGDSKPPSVNNTTRITRYRAQLVVAISEDEVCYAFVLLLFPLAVFALQLLGCIRKGWVVTLAYGFLLSLLFVTFCDFHSSPSQIRLKQAG
eukprot:TRINITY_DN19164_c0_g1_i1.p1 TRINITY_DN19164_c0_g1~~TRINITY_DN19164_c0_g1_i1.p1  ORF type:complete len:353 (+),score=12.07 TRINITY_DN19164_c0_g1_i1:66-1124(+)